MTKIILLEGYPTIALTSSGLVVFFGLQGYYSSGNTKLYYFRTHIEIPLHMNSSILALLFFFCSYDSVPEVPESVKKDLPATFPYSVVINEFMVRQEDTLKDPDFGQYSSWIELLNREDVEVEISGWILAGQPLNTHSNHAYIIPDGTTIAPGDFLLFWADGIGVIQEAIHTSFTLSEDGGKIGLYGPEQVGTPVVDTVSYHSLDVASDISMGRITFGRYDDHNGFLLPMNAPTPGEENRLAKLQLRESFELDIEDPSGLGVDHTGNYLWVVSDMSGGSIYKVTKTGRIVEELKVGGHDMESISQHPDNLLLYVAEERRRTIVQYDTLGNKIRSDSVAVDIRHRNRGLEGLTINPANNHVFVSNKMIPRVLIELDLSKEKGEQQIRFTPIDFGGPSDANGTSDDASKGLSLAGLFFDCEEEVLWVVSDRARAVFVLDHKGRPLAAYDADEYDLEGIAVINKENRIYLASDSNQTLFVFDYPQPLIRLPASD